MVNPKVSFIVTCYNYEDYIEQAINSVLNQTVQDFEIIVADDCSVDNSVGIIKSLAQNDNRIKLITNDKNIGLKRNLQKAIQEAQGQWIAFLETDDTLASNYLAEKLNIIENYNNVGFIFNRVEFTGPNANLAQIGFKNIISRNSKRKYPINMFYDFGYENPVLTMSSVMVKKSLLKNIDFNTPIDKLTDWYIYIQIALNTYFYYIDKPLTFWNQHNDSYVKQNKKIKFKFANIASYVNIYKAKPYNIKLLLFIIISTFQMCFKRIMVYSKK